MATNASSSLCCLGRSAFRTTQSLPVSGARFAKYTTITSTTSSPVISSRQQSSIVKHGDWAPSTLSEAVVARRSASSTSATSSPSTSPSTSSPHSAVQQPTLTWDEFLKLRRTRRYVNLAASMFSGVGSIAIATPLIAEYEIENIGAQLTGLDPMFVIGGSLVAVGGVGWLMGPFLGTAFFKVWKSSVAGEFARKDKLFYGHIKQYRADPASSSVNNPVPDYYGEKIGSVADYRRWLKDQRAFNRKKNKNMI
ncbi:hypothetical protein AAFC00_003888 [Neodothiora populina]|uniref:Presequence translocated-associated motor subunit PAM17 n=1 Tax=Neodothiora populina TaxID=2781224 RepID=A0ABR3PFQ8_9PEZI